MTVEEESKLMLVMVGDLFLQEEIEIKSKALCMGKTLAIVNVELKKKKNATSSRQLRGQLHVSVSSPQENKKKDVDDSIAASNEDTKQRLRTPKEGIDFDMNAESLDLTRPNRHQSQTATETTTASEEYRAGLWS
ncbi:hypothetical protein Bca52824_018671 [Brassica carinata]|uniref:Uncharacterized protein n=1 Tax=Brassica carinata TaxID=52824 RepID=A0A8X8AWL4_BRACI|nr:hypothetical protein Bca52824_018671 [Brassica carinata]